MFSKEQASKLFKTMFWEDMEPKDICVLQMSQDRMLMPYMAFHDAMETTLGRGLFMNEIPIKRWDFMFEIAQRKYALSDAECLQLIPERFRLTI